MIQTAISSSSTIRPRLRPTRLLEMKQSQVSAQRKGANLGHKAQAILKNLGWRFCTMAKLVYGLNQSLDGYVDHLKFRPGPALFRHFLEHARDLTGMVYGRGMYEVMRYW